MFRIALMLKKLFRYYSLGLQNPRLGELMGLNHPDLNVPQALWFYRIKIFVQSSKITSDNEYTSLTV